MRRYPYQHMHVVAMDRSSVDGHLLRPRDFPQQLPRPLPDISTQHRKPVLRYPHDMILAVPDRVTSGLRILHTRSVGSQRWDSKSGVQLTDSWLQPPETPGLEVQHVADRDRERLSWVAPPFATL